MFIVAYTKNIYFIDDDVLKLQVRVELLLQVRVASMLRK